jgi:hypothetical protein
MFVTLALSFPDLFQLIQRAQVDANNGHDYFHLWELNLAREIVPQTYHFPKLVNWCTINYQVEKRLIFSTDHSRVICHINRESIAQMLQFPNLSTSKTLDDDVLAPKYQALLQPKKESLLSNLLTSNAPLPVGSPPYKLEIFPEITRHAITMICQTLGYEHQKII